jgi:hypothetical protein
MAQLGGIWCPYNPPGKNKNGPANMGEEGVYCLVWKNWNDFNDNAAENNFNYCRNICQYGHHEAAKRYNEERARKAFHARKFQRETFATKLSTQFKLRFPQLEMRKIAPWEHHVKPKPLKPTRFGRGGKLPQRKKFKLPDE